MREWVALRDRNAARPDSFPSEGIVTVTWADLASFARCPLQFKLNRESELDERAESRERDEVHAGAGGESAVPRGVDPAVFGSFVHEILERSIGGKDLDGAIEASLATVDFGKARAAAVDTARKLAEHAIAAGLAGPASGARAEVPVMVRLENIIVRGVIDRLDTGAESVVTDYKVGERSDDHAFQVRAYLWAARRAGVPEPIHGRVAYLRENGANVVDVTPDDGLEGRVGAIDAAIAAGEFVATPGAVCAACPHRAVCAFAV